MRQRFITPAGITVSYTKYGSGPPLVLVHGSFTDDETNWEFVKPMLEARFAVYAIARRGRGDTDATVGHGVEDEAADVVALVKLIGEPVFLLGHSYGAHCSLVAAAAIPALVRHLMLYEAPWPRIITGPAMARLEELAAAGAWDELAFTFFRDTLFVPVANLEADRASALWPPIVGDARASLGDIRALSRYAFKAHRFSALDIPVLLQVGSESPRDLFITDALASVLPDVRVETLAGQAHEGMTTAPEQYASSVFRFVLG